MLTRNKLSEGSSKVSFDRITQKHSPEKCRICLDDGEIPIFGTNDISKEVTEFGRIEVGKDDNLPQYLCEACHTLLEAAILFRKSAQEADEELKKPEYLESASIASNDSDYINENEPYIKREYLELDYTSESDLDNFDTKQDCVLDTKQDCPSEDDADSKSITKAQIQVDESQKDYKIKLINMKEEGESNQEADSEMIMIIVSDKDKQNQGQPGCVKCNIAFKTVEELVLHNDKTHPKPLPGERECDICHKFIQKGDYKSHLKEHREKYKVKHNKKYGKVECKDCGKKVSKAYYKYHLKLHGPAEVRAERLIECPICNKTFDSHYYNDHIKRVHPDKTNIKSSNEHKPSPTNIKLKKCPVCDKNVKESDYKLHLEKHGGPLRRYICDKCGKVFKHPSTFKTHCLTHGSELKYKCQFCPYRGLHQGLLKIHVRTHTGDYNYKCTECPAQFITKSNLSKHLQRHKGQCSFKCDICGRGFYNKRDVDKHIKIIHLDLKNHICEICGKGFGHRDNMLNHQLKVHKREKIITKGRMPSYLKNQMQLDEN